MNDELRATRRLSAIRIAVGALLIVRTTPLVALVPGPAHTNVWMGWPDGRWTTTLATAVPAIAIRALVVVRTLGAAALMLGVRARWTGIVAASAAIAVLTQDAFAATHTLRLLFAATGLVAIDGGCARAIVADRPFAPRASLGLLRAFVVSVYAWSAVAKLGAEWMSGRTIAAFRDDGLIAGIGARVLLATPARCEAIAIAVFALEALLGPALLFRRTRATALVVAVAFHVVLEIVVHPDLFGFVMLALLVSFVGDDQKAVDSGTQPPPSQPRLQ
jgi:hypothetical protein